MVAPEMKLDDEGKPTRASQSLFKRESNENDRVKSCRSVCNDKVDRDTFALHSLFLTCACPHFFYPYFYRLPQLFGILSSILSDLPNVSVSNIFCWRRGFLQAEELSFQNQKIANQ
jgi:hypothetical protein